MAYNHRGLLLVIACLSWTWQPENMLAVAWVVGSSHFVTLQRNHPLTSVSRATHLALTKNHHLSMDMERPMDAREKRVLKNHKISIPGVKLQQLTIPRRERKHNWGSVHSHTDTQHAEIDRVAARHGMPWKTSIDPTYQNIHPCDDDDKKKHSKDGLFYMPFWEWQLDFMKQHLTNLHVLPVVNRQGRDLSYVENTTRRMRLHTLQCASDEYKCIRMTVLDAGPKTQVFTSLWYPNPVYANAPLLGTDLLQFQQSKHLCIVDLQPIHSTTTNKTTTIDNESANAVPYEHLLKPIRDQYPSLHGKMTQRFYDENMFFSKQMLLGRCDTNKKDALPQNSDDASLDNGGAVGNVDWIYRDLFPAYQAYVQTHVQLLQSMTPQYDSIPSTLQRHAVYDQYSAKRDPAHGLLAAGFGKEFADDYMHDVLFPLSKR